jgi:hypothetical protein
VYPTPHVDYTKYKTYFWLPPRMLTSQGVKDGDPHIAPLIKNSVNRELAKKGFQEVEKDGDLEVVSIVMDATSPQLEGFLLGYGFDPFWGYGVNTVAPVGRYNKEGTLAVGLVDPKTKKGVWVGMATEATGHPENAAKILDKAAGRLFKKFPPKK